jgi:alkaline phosphatase
MISRRRFLGSSSALAGVAATGFPHVARSADKPAASRRPRHIIQLVADGMSAGTLTLGDHLSQILRQGRGLTWMKLARDPAVVSALMNMRSLNSLVTDSAAAASSWGSGSRVINGAINQLPDGRNLKTLYELFAEIGWKRGLVTTTEITHATPAGFAANVDDRDTGTAIAVQYLERKVDVLLGGGQKFFDPKERKDKRNLREDFATAGYRVMQTAAELRDAPLDARWLGLFEKSHLPYTVDHVNDPKLRDKVPTLAQMTTRALEWLGPHEHFILQVEGGRVDQGCHNCDAVAALRDLIAFDEALDVVLEFQRRVPDTLIVITTDHGNGNPGLNGVGSAYGHSSFLFDNVADVTKSFPKILDLIRRTEKTGRIEDAPPAGDRPRRGPGRDGTDLAARGRDDDAGRVESKDEAKEDDPAEEKKDDEARDDEEKQSERPSGRSRGAPRDRILVASAPEIVEVIRASTGYKMSLRRAEQLIPYLAKTSRSLYDVMNNETAALGQVMGNYLGIGWAGNVHTADYVVLTALGPGAELFRGYVENTDVFYHYLGLVGIDFRNPTEPLVAESAPAADEVERLDEYSQA